MSGRWLATAALAVVLSAGGCTRTGAIRETQPPRRTTSTALTSRATAPGRQLPPAVELVATYPIFEDVMTAGDGRYFALEGYGLHGERVRIARVDPDGRVDRADLKDPLGGYYFAAREQSGWLYVATSVIQRITHTPNELVRIHASSLSVVDRTTLPDGVVSMASDPHDIWVALVDGRILRIDPASLSVLASCAVPGATPPPAGSSSFGSLALGPGGLWATFGSARRTMLYRLDPRSLAVLSRRTVPESGQGILVMADSQAVWLTGTNFARRVDAYGNLSDPLRIPELDAAAAVGHGLLVLSIPPSSTSALEQLTLYDEQGRMLGRSNVGDAGGQLAIDGADVWLGHGRAVAQWRLGGPVP